MHLPEMWFLSESLIRDVVGRKTEPVDSDDNMVRWDRVWDPRQMKGVGQQVWCWPIGKAVRSRHTALRVD